MGKRSNWFAAVKKAFQSSSKAAPRQTDDLKGAKSTRKEEESKQVKDKRRWPFSKSTPLDSVIPQSKPDAVSAKSPNQGDQKQNKHVLAIAAATAAAAEAAVAAAHAAAEVVRLTGDMQAGRPSSYNSTCDEDWAAIKIQTAFRGYLARRALRALRGLVRLQARVRGHTVRRQATLTLRCMQALVRVQARVRARRVRMSEEGQAVQRKIWQRRQQEMLSLKANSGSGQDVHGLWDDSLQTMEEVEAKRFLKQEAAMKRERALAYAFAHQLWRSPPRESTSLYIDIRESIDKPHWGWSWLERWMAARPWEAAHSFEKETMGMITAMENQFAVRDLDMAIKHVPHAPSIKLPTAANTKTPIGTTTMESVHTILAPKHGGSTAEVQGSGAVKPMVSTTPSPSPMGSSTTTSMPQRPITVRVRPASPQGAPTRFAEEGGSCASTARSAQSMYSAAGVRFNFHNRRSSMAGSSVRDEDSLVGSPAVPNYMAATQSARAKVRSLSSPKQRKGGDTPERERQQSNHMMYAARKRLSFTSVSTTHGSAREESAYMPNNNKRPIQRSPSVNDCSFAPRTFHADGHSENLLQALAR